MTPAHRVRIEKILARDDGKEANISTLGVYGDAIEVEVFYSGSP